MQLSIIIVNYNVKFFLEHCLLSVLKACATIEAEILVVDNNSSDGSQEYLTSKFPTIKFYWNNTNPGFGKANNSVLKYTKGDHILFLNPDTIVPEDCFTKCISFFKSHKDCAALGVRMVDGSGNFLKESKRCLPTAAAGFFKMVGLANMFPSSSFLANYYAGHLPEKENNKTEVLAGAFMMLNKKAIEITKGFDEDFFMYGEDIDLSYRILKAGLQNYYLGESTIIHFKGESTQKNSSDYFKHFYGAINKFVLKHYANKPFTKHCMIGMIACGKAFAKLNSFLSKNKIHSSVIQKLNVLFIGNQLQFEKTNAILKGSHFIITQKIFFPNSIAFEKLFAEKIMDASVNTFLFCEGENSNISIIEKLQQLPKNYTALFYENGAYSIIGSNNKNWKGIFISTH